MAGPYWYGGGHTGMATTITVAKNHQTGNGLNRYGPHNTGMVGATPVQKINRYGPAGSFSRLILTLKITVSGLFKTYFQNSSFGHPFLSLHHFLKFWTPFFKF